MGFGINGNAAFAIDGNRNGNFFQGSVTITNNTDPSPSDDGLFDWWQLQLDQVYSITSLNLFGRTDCCQDRIDPFRLELFNGDTLDQVYPVEKKLPADFWWWKDETKK